MDTLCFSTPVLLRHLTFSEQRKMPITEVELLKSLEGLELSMPQFVDLCILLGCDYLEPIKGVGPATALKLIKEHKNLEGVIAHIKANPESRFKIPEVWPFEDARDLFLNPEIQDTETLDLKWEEPDVPGLVEYLVKDKGFNEERVLAGAARLKKNLKTAQQGRLDGFFKVVGTSSSTPSAKRKAADNAKGDKGKKAKGKKK